MDIIIGKGNYGHTAIKVFDIDHDNISQNNVSYWVHNCIFDCDLVIFKNTNEGKKLTNLIKKNVSSMEFNKFLDSIVLKKINIENVYTAIKNISDESYELGKRNKITEIKDVLNINETTF